MRMVAIPLWILLLTLGAAADRRVEVHGHRGARAVRPENTLAAFRYALEAGVDYLELDLGVSKDGVLVVYHDQYVNPALCKDRNGSAVQAGQALYSLTLARLRQFDCGGETIPTLDEVLALGRDPRYARVGFNIETKIRPEMPYLAPPPEEFARMVVERVRKHGMETRTIIQSFDFRTLRTVKRIAPEIRRAALDSSGRADFVTLAREAEAQIISPEKKLVTRARVAAAHAAGLKVVPWTANTAEEWNRLIGAGVDGIITDDPAALITYLNAERGRR